jgi:glyoxylase-like metal-dependent hydrolase (beta-lactamase superfamily II)
MILKKLSLAILTISFTFSYQSAFAHGDLQTKNVKDNIYVIQGKGGNIGLFIGKDGTFLIDDKFAPMSEAILAEIKEAGGEVPKYLLNTHFHADHSGGNENFGKKGSVIIAHDNVRKRLSEGSSIPAFNMDTPPANAPALPTITFSKDMHLHLNNDDVKAIHIENAHTDGDSIIVFKKANVIHTGDVFFNGFFPFIDANNGGNLQGMIKGADTILALANAETKIIPGHGPVGNIDDLKAYREMLSHAHKSLLTLKKQGLSAEQAIEKKPLASLDKQWGGGFLSTDKWIKIVYPAVD